MSYQTTHKAEIMARLNKAFEILNTVRIMVDEQNRERVRHVLSEVCDLMEVVGKGK